jgi:hypothetical protein
MHHWLLGLLSLLTQALLLLLGLSNVLLLLVVH